MDFDSHEFDSHKLDFFFNPCMCASVYSQLTFHSLQIFQTVKLRHIFSRDNFLGIKFYDG